MVNKFTNIKYNTNGFKIEAGILLQEVTGLLIGVIADTHMPRRGKELPLSLLHVLEKVDLIIHAGDLTELSILNSLSGIAPVVAVAGNIDSPEVVQLLGYKKNLEVGKHRIGIIHGHGSRGTTLERAYKAFFDVDCIIFGHSHIPYCNRHANVLMFNPGSPTDKRRQPKYSYGLLRVEETIQGELFYFQ